MKETQQSTKLERHIETLQRQHDLLDFEIEMQFKQYGNDSVVQTLKKKKLKLKDEIEQFKKESTGEQK